MIRGRGQPLSGPAKPESPAGAGEDRSVASDVVVFDETGPLSPRPPWSSGATGDGTRARSATSEWTDRRLIAWLIEIKLIDVITDPRLRS